MLNKRQSNDPSLKLLETFRNDTHMLTAYENGASRLKYDLESLVKNAAMNIALIAMDFYAY